MRYRKRLKTTTWFACSTAAPVVGRAAFADDQAQAVTVATTHIDPGAR